MKRFKMRGALLLFTAFLTQFSCAAISGKFPLERNRRLWNESKISNYRMTMEIQKTGHRMPMGFAVVEVRGGQPVSFDRVPDKWFACGMDTCGRYDTVEEIFAVIEQAQKQNPEELITEYDPKYGYPTHLRMDIAKTTFDDELMIKIMHLEVIE